MSFVFLIIGAILVDAGVRGTTEDSVNGNGDGRGLFPLVKGDIDQFFMWFLAILLIGAVGYIKDLRVFANSLLALVIIVMFVSKKGSANVSVPFFGAVEKFFASQPSSAAAIPVGTLPTSFQGVPSGGQLNG